MHIFMTTFYNYLLESQNIGENKVNLIIYSHIEFIIITCHDKHLKKKFNSVSSLVILNKEQFIIFI